MAEFVLEWRGALAQRCSETMKTIPICLLMISSALTAQEPVMDLEARKESVVNLEAHIAQREARLTQSAQDLINLDKRIERQVDDLVKLLAGVKDSQDSRVQVSKMKQEAIDGLKRGIQAYADKRRELAERARKGDEAAAGDLGKFDERIAKRVDQIVELGKSFPTHTDTEKYESEGGSYYWNGYYEENTRISEAWRQNRRDSTQSSKVRDELTKAIDANVARMEQRKAAINDTLKNRQPTEAERELYQQELGRLDAYLDQLQRQRMEVTVVSTADSANPLGTNEAHDLGNLIDDARRDLRQDISNLFRQYDRFTADRAQLDALRKNLEARKQWLKEHAGDS